MTMICECDGCGRQQKSPDGMTRVNVRYDGNLTDQKEQMFDLCSSCLSTFRGSHVPTRWPRMAKATAAE